MTPKVSTAMKRIGVILFGAILLYGIIWTVLWFTGWTPHQRADAIFSAGRECEDKTALANLEEAEREKARECAITEYREAIQLFDKDWRYHFRLAEVLVEADRQQALEEYLTAYGLAPSEPGPAEGVKRILNLVEAEVVQVGEGYDIFSKSAISPYSISSTEDADAEISFDIADRYYYPSNPEGDTRSIQIQWRKKQGQWASLIFGIDAQINDLNRAMEADMKRLDLSSPEQYALQFAILGVEGGEIITVKFQDQNILIKESLGNQVSYDIKAETDWYLYCIPLEGFGKDLWIQRQYQGAEEVEFDWANVKQVNFDPHYNSEYGTIYLDEVRVVKASTCAPTGNTTND